MRLTEHFTLDELIVSETAARQGIDNEPGFDVMPNLRVLADGLEQVRALLGHPIIVTSGYRCAALNQAVGGAADSDHVRGLAADLICPAYGPPIAVCQAIAASSIEFDQLIHEFGRWTHIAFPAATAMPRRQLLTIAKGTGYRPGLLDVA